MVLTFLRWRDACQEDAAAPKTPVPSSPLVELIEVGWLIGDTDESVSIAMEIEKDGSPSRWRLHVPKVNIIARRDVEVNERFHFRHAKRSKPNA